MANIWTCWGIALSRNRNLTTTRDVRAVARIDQVADDGCERAGVRSHQRDLGTRPIEDARPHRAGPCDDHIVYQSVLLAEKFGPGLR
jgi:hypothetical protein